VRKHPNDRTYCILENKQCALTRIVSHIANGKRKHVAEATVIA
jgi:hypothetical protein